MMMRVFEALGCEVIDEPFYAYWLNATQRVDDPGYAATLAHHETDWRRVAEMVITAGRNPHARSYQKHMAIHMLAEVDLGFMTELQNCFLIRHPAEVIASMAAFRSLTPKTTADVAAAAYLVGIPQLERIFDEATRIQGGIPTVVDANDVLQRPSAVLAEFCQSVGLPFDPSAPIQWAPGKHPNDGAWADEWYQSVFATEGLQPYQARPSRIPDALEPVLEYCLPSYERIAQHKIKGFS